jgi:small-conductance mechanosensitive channel
MDFARLGPWGQFAVLMLVVVLVAQLALRLLRPVALRVASFSTVLTHIVRRCDRPMRAAVPLAVIQLALQGLPDDMPGLAGVEHVFVVLTICGFTWLAVASLRGLADGVIAKHPADATDNLGARRIHTQTRVLTRIACGLVVVAGVSFVLMTFPRARQMGASLLASAGIVGVFAGIAARSVFSNLLAGLHIALAQPIRIDDVLIVEGEWGRVEEITATYVVLKLWDERRLVVPLGWFTEHPFQNWTRHSAQLVGTVFLWADYTLPIEPLRREAQRLCEASPRWDGRVCVVQVTDAGERAMQIRILASSADSGRNFELRCEVREGLIQFVQREYPHALPTFRARVVGAEEGGTAANAPAAQAS